MERDDLMQKARANKCVADALSNPRNHEQIQLAAFLDFMHPEMSQERKDALVRDAGKE